MKEDKKIDYDGLPYWIMEYCAKNQKSGKLTCALYTDDFQYSDWQKILPPEWIDDAIKNGDVNMALEKYFNVMGDLEQLFSDLCYFHIDNSGTFPEQILYIRLKTGDVMNKEIKEIYKDFRKRTKDTIKVTFVTKTDFISEYDRSVD